MQHSNRSRRSAGRRWAGRLVLAGTVAAATAVTVVSVDGSGPSRATAGPGDAALAAVGKGARSGVPAPPAHPTTSLAPPEPTTTLATNAPPSGTGSWFLPDGSVLPVLLVYDGHTITLAGALPSQAAVARLYTLAQAYSNVPGTIVSHVVVDPHVPASVGLRVIEMNAGRFAEGSSTVTAQYAPELTRVVVALKSMPNITLSVIGHADPTGGAGPNVQLSVARAESVVDYLISQGVSAGRLSAQGVGASDPLTDQANAAGLALDRRTEFVFYGLFAGLGQ